MAKFREATMMRKKCHHKQDEVNYVISEKGDGVTGATMLTRITGFAWLYWAALDCTGLYSAVLCCTRLYSAVLGWTGVYWTVLDCTGLYWAVLGCTGLYWAALDCTGLYWVWSGDGVNAGKGGKAGDKGVHCPEKKTEKEEKKKGEKRRRMDGQVESGK